MIPNPLKATALFHVPHNSSGATSPLPSPFCSAMPLSLVEQLNDASLVRGLLVRGGPPHVTRLIMSFVIDAIQGVSSCGLVPQISVKSPKSPRPRPFFVYFDSPASIVGPRRGVGIAASLNHCLPARVFGRAVFAMVCDFLKKKAATATSVPLADLVYPQASLSPALAEAVSDGSAVASSSHFYDSKHSVFMPGKVHRSISKGLGGKAPAACSVASFQICCNDRGRFTAIAPTKPQGVPSPRAYSIYSQKPPKLLAANFPGRSHIYHLVGVMK